MRGESEELTAEDRANGAGIVGCGTLQSQDAVDEFPVAIEEDVGMKTATENVLQGLPDGQAASLSSFSFKLSEGAVSELIECSPII